MDPVAAFRNEVETLGLMPSELAPDGILRRCPTQDKPRDKTGWFVLYGDPPAGAFGNWRTGESRTWCGNGGMDPESKRRIQARIEEARKEREAEQAESYAEAAKEARQALEPLPPATAENPYLKRKGVKPCHGLKADGETLLVPVYGPDGRVMSMQTIEADGTKRFHPGGRTRGGYFPVKGNSGPLYLVEGIATSLSIHEATGGTVLCSFTAGNLEPVAELARQKYPKREIIIAGDDDAKTEAKTGRNPGKEAALQAARAVGGKVAFPVFQAGEGSDFNDLAQVEGIEMVRRCLEAARDPEPAQAPDDWPEPLPLPDGLPAVAPFDYALLPESLKPWAADIVDRMQCPADYVAATLMVALSAVIGRKVGIRPQASTDWVVIVNLWALLIGRPGVLKSPAMEAALAALNYLIAKALEEYRERWLEYESSRQINKLRKDAAEAAARKVLKDDPNADVSEILNVEIEEAPTLRRYMTNDSTMAALAELLRANPNGLLVYRDEIISLLRTLDAEENADAKGFFMTGWNGDSSYTSDRIGRGLNLYVPAVCMSLIGSTQPARVGPYVKGTLDGSGDDGLLQRFQLTVWPDTVGDWKEIDRWPDTDAKNQAFKVFERLDKLDPSTIGARQDTGINGDPDGVPYLRFDPAGLDLFRGWRQDLETRLRSGELHPALESHFAKYRKLVPALALILHLSNGDTGPVGNHAVLQALAWSEYLGTHARRLYASITAPEVATAKAILKKIRNGDLLTVFAGWQVWRPGWSGLTDKKAIYEALELLVDLGWIVARRRDTGGRPSVEYELNPKANLEGVK